MDRKAAAMVLMLAAVLLTGFALHAGTPCPVFDGPVGLVVIDPGHGGGDPGAVRNGIKEKDLVLRVALSLQARLESRGVEVLMTRDGDLWVGLQERCDLANAAVWPEDATAAFVSIHANSAEDGSVGGFEVFYAPKEERGGFLTSKTDPLMGFRFAALNKEQAAALVAQASFRLASSIGKAMGKELGLVDRGVKKERFYVIRNTFMPSVLVELGFLSNAREARKINSEAFVRKAAEAICDGILGY